MLRLLLSALGLAAASSELVFTNTTGLPIVGNYTFGYINNTVQNRCHRGVAKFQAQQTGVVDALRMGVYSQAAPETCGISFVLATFPAATPVGSSLLTTFTDLVAARPGTEEYLFFNASLSSWTVAAGQNYTITILPFTWASGPAGTTATQHCVFDVPYGKPGLPYFFLGSYGPTAMPCGSTPWTIDDPGDGQALQILLTGHPAQVIVPSATSSHTPTPTSTITPTPSTTGTPTPSPTPTGTPSNTETPTPTISSGATASNSATNTRTPSRTPSISYSPTPTPSMTPSPTASHTPSPTPTLRIGASPSVTPTETPGPTDSPSPKPIAGINTVPVPAPPAPQASAGAIIGAAIGGGLGVVALLALAVRLQFIHAELNPQRKATRKIKHTPSFPETVQMNPVLNQSSAAQRVQRMKNETHV